MMPTTIESPSSRDVFTLDGDTCPGKSEIVSGGEAADKIEDQPQLLTKGANTVVRGTLNAVTVYKLTMFTIPQLQKWMTWEKMFLEGRSRVPNPRVYQLQDLRYSWVGRVIFEKMTPEGVDAPGGPWTRQLTLHQWNRVAPYGGPIRVQAIDAAITVAQAARDASRQRLATAVAAAEAARRAK